MKKYLCTLLVSLLTLACTGCGTTPPVSENTAPSERSVSAVCGAALTDFEDGADDDALTSLSFRDGQARAYTITDKAVVAEIWGVLKAVTLDDARSGFGICDADIDFVFRRESGAELGLRFVTPDCFEIWRDGASVYYPVLAPEIVRYCRDLATAAGEGAALPEKPGSLQTK